MKTAIYIEDGVVQLVLTPETDYEKRTLATFGQKPLSAKLFQGQFYDCRGGWTRQSTFYPEYAFASHQSGADHSLILRVDERPPEPEQGA